MGRIFDIIKARAIDKIVGDAEFVEKVATEIANTFDYGHIADGFDISADDIAYHLDADTIIEEIVDSIDESAVAEHIEIDYDEVAQRVSKKLNMTELYDAIAEEILENL